MCYPLIRQHGVVVLLFSPCSKKGLNGDLLLHHGYTHVNILKGYRVSREGTCAVHLIN